MPECLPRRCAEIARGLLKTAIEPVENRKHDQEAKRQGPCQMSAKARRKKPHCRCPTLSATFDDEIVKQPESQGNTVRRNNRRHDQAYDGHIKQQGRAAERFAEGETRRNRKTEDESNDV